MNAHGDDGGSPRSARKTQSARLNVSSTLAPIHARFSLSPVSLFSSHSHISLESPVLTALFFSARNKCPLALDTQCRRIGRAVKRTIFHSSQQAPSRLASKHVDSIISHTHTAHTLHTHESRYVNNESYRRRVGPARVAANSCPRNFDRPARHSCSIFKTKTNKENRKSVS